LRVITKKKKRKKIPESVRRAPAQPTAPDADRDGSMSAAERETTGYEPFERGANTSDGSMSAAERRIFIEHMKPDRKLKASREGSK